MGSIPNDRYRSAGVDIEKGNQFVRQIKPIVQSTHGPQVLGGLGGFAAFYALDCPNPVLVSSTDGVGTKLKLAFMLGIHDSVGIDLVGMCVNDIIVYGAKPLFMLDYFSTGVLLPQVAAAVVQGIAEGCKQAHCALVGGETAEMPGFYPPGEYDLAGFVVGAASREALIDGSKVRPGSAVIGLASSGLHSNGYSLARHIIFQQLRLNLDHQPSELDAPLGQTLLTPTIIYVDAFLALQAEFAIQAAAHITGGGIRENLPRALPADCRAIIRRNSWEVPPIFSFLQKAGKLSQDEMYRTFNSGVGMTVILPADQAQAAVARLNHCGCRSFLIGEIAARKAGQDAVEII
jgi:phosphoribosylformylglycinamidine cyclo-ligase